MFRNDRQPHAQRHAMHMTGRADPRPVEIAVRVDPDHAQFLVFGRAPDGTQRNAVVAAQHQGKITALDGDRNSFRHLAQVCVAVVQFAPGIANPDDGFSLEYTFAESF